MQETCEKSVQSRGSMGAEKSHDKKNLSIYTFIKLVLLTSFIKVSIKWQLMKDPI